MTYKLRTFSSSIGIFIGSLLFSLALSAFASTTWTPPSTLPPNGNVDVPLNVGTTNQTKTGGSIQINGGFGIAGGPFVYVPTGATPTAGQVLTADATTPGKVVWANAPSSIQKPSYFYDIGYNTGNNNSINRIIAVLDPGTYTFSGKIIASANGGGGAAAVVFNTSDNADFFNSAQNWGSGVNCTAGIVYGMHWNSECPSNILFYFTHTGSGSGSSGNWTISPTTVTFATTTYLYLLGSQVNMTGYVHY